MGVSGTASLAGRAHDALGEAVADAIKAHFAGCLVQLDGGASLAAVTAHFRKGIADVEALRAAAAAVIDEQFGGER